MRIQSGQLVTLGYGRYVRSDEIVAVEPITEGRGPGRRCLVWVRGVPDPIVASRSQAAIIAEMTTPAESPGGGGAGARGGMVRGLRDARTRRPPAARASKRARATAGAGKARAKGGPRRG
ncbi:MAG TPA: hypothetical protein VEZ14_06910 [Dehalococcoidia bacterium]|nr:hypothetical protein [Dehalococcoidia bacterium]